MHPLVFETVLIYRSVKSIQADLFKNFHQISYINLNVDSLMNFVHKIGLAWTTSLPVTSQSWINLAKYNEDYGNWIDGSEYLYPDEDFCLFAQYQHQDFLIYILSNLANLTQCTHTIRYLLSNYYTQKMSLVFNTFPGSKLIFTICKNSSNEKVDDSKQMLSNCNISHFDLREAIRFMPNIIK
jgi:hypothetical protein